MVLADPPNGCVHTGLLFTAQWAACLGSQGSSFQVIFHSLMMDTLNGSVPWLCVWDIKGLRSRAGPALVGSRGVSHSVCFIV